MLTWDDPSERYFHHGVDRGVFYPSKVPPPRLDATNLATRPIPTNTDISSLEIGLGYSGQYYQGSSTRTLIAEGMDGPLVRGKRLGYRRKTITALDGSIRANTWMFTGRNTDVPGPYANDVGAIPVTAGRRYRLSYMTRFNLQDVSTDLFHSISVRGYNAGVATYLPIIPGVVYQNNVWYEHSVLLPVIPDGVTCLALRQTFGGSRASTIGDTSDITGLIFTDVTNNTSLIIPYFDGNSMSDAYEYDWAGSVNDSSSTRSLIVGTAIPWNGITGFDESGNGDSSIHYVDGQVYLADVDPTDFSGKLSAYSWPDEFSEALGFPEVADGLYVDNQKPKRFDFSYRSLIGSGSTGDMFGYQIHLVYKAMASFAGRSRKTINNNSDPLEFGFDLVCTPVALPQYRPSAHYVIDTRHLAKATVTQLEGILYGDATHAPRMPTPTELFDILNFGTAITFVKFPHPVLGECWTASGAFSNVHYTGDGSTFEILNVNGSWISEPDGQYQLQDTP